MVMMIRCIPSHPRFQMLRMIKAYVDWLLFDLFCIDRSVVACKIFGISVLVCVKNERSTFQNRCNTDCAYCTLNTEK